MKSSLRYLLLLVTTLLCMSANASLIGTTVNIGYVDQNANTLDSVLVTAGLEYTQGDGSNLASSVPGSLGVFESIDIGANYIDIAFLLSINAGASPAAFTFSNLTHVVAAALDFSDIATITSADLQFSGDTLIIDVGNQTPANYNPAAHVRISLVIPSPGTLVLLAMGLIVAMVTARIRST